MSVLSSLFLLKSDFSWAIPGPERQWVSTKQMLFLCMCLIFTVDLWCATKGCEKQWPYFLWSAASVEPREVIFLFYVILSPSIILLLFTFLLTWHGYVPACAPGSGGNLAFLSSPGQAVSGVVVAPLHSRLMSLNLYSWAFILWLAKAYVSSDEDSMPSPLDQAVVITARLLIFFS